MMMYRMLVRRIVLCTHCDASVVVVDDDAAENMIRTKEPCALFSHYILISICVWRCVYDCEKRVTWERAEMSSSVKGVCVYICRPWAHLSNERYTRFSIKYLPSLCATAWQSLLPQFDKKKLISTEASHIFIVEMKKSQVPGIELY